MGRVKGIGGVFFKSKKPEELQAWYARHLGVPEGEGGVMFRWREQDAPDSEQMTVWAPFPHDTDYFEPSNAPYMINYIVDELDEFLEELRAQGVWIDQKREDHPYGRFAWIKDPEGVRIELWEPPKTQDTKAST